MSQKLVLDFLRVGLSSGRVNVLIHKAKELQISLKTPTTNKE